MSELPLTSAGLTMPPLETSVGTKTVRPLRAVLRRAADGQAKLLKSKAADGDGDSNSPHT